MIIYVSTQQERAVLAGYLGYWGKDLRHSIKQTSYDRLFRWKRLPYATYIFSDIERLSANERERAAAVWVHLEKEFKDILLINHPLKVKRRYDLLTALYDAKINRFNVYRANSEPQPQKYPVFFKRENDHVEPESQLLQSREELEQAIVDCGTRLALDDFLVTEFHAEPDSQGRYWKYSAFIFNGVIVPAHIFIEAKWYVKIPRLADEATAQLELDYVRDNPHREILERVARIAHIDYGRIDYGVINDEVQVYEINTNPMIMGPRDGNYALRSKAREYSHEQIRQGFLDLNSGSGKETEKSIPAPHLKHKPWWQNRGLAYSLCDWCLTPLGMGRLVPVAYLKLDRIVPLVIKTFGINKNP